MHSLIGCVCICATGSINNIQSRSIPYLLFFSFLNHFCQISSSAACFLFYWRGWGPLENTKKFTFSFHLSQNSGFFLEFWLFSPEFDFVWNSKLLWIRTSFLEFWFFWGEFWLFSWNLTSCGIPHFCEFWLFSWTSDFLWIPTSFLEFWFFGGEFWLLPGTSDFFEILTFFLEFEHFFCYSDFFWILNFSRNFDFLGNSDFFWILNFWVNSDFFLLFWLFLNYNIFLDFWLFSWTVDFSLNF